ncbi:MAG: hypothetical protein ACHRXM_06510 [Isosphaerales bacterium]
MDEVLTIDEIKARYAPDWVLIGEPLIDESQRLLAGKVLFHSPDRDAVYDKILEYPPGRYGFRFLGEIPEDMVLVQ